MRKLFVACAFLTGACTLAAQTVTLSPEAGISAVQRNGWGQGWRPAAKIGVSADFGVNRFFSVESGLFYTFRGYTVENGGEYSNEGLTWIEHVSQTRHFLQLPVMAKFSWSLDSHTKMFFGVGPYIGVCLKNRFDSNPIFLNNSELGGYAEFYDGMIPGVDQFGGTNQYLYDKARTFDWGLAANVGIETQKWIVRLHYDLSLGKESDGDVIGANYHTLTLSVGYKFHL